MRGLGTGTAKAAPGSSTPVARSPASVTAAQLTGFEGVPTGPRNPGPRDKRKGKFAAEADVATVNETAAVILGADDLEGEPVSADKSSAQPSITALMAGDAPLGPQSGDTAIRDDASREEEERALRARVFASLRKFPAVAPFPGSADSALSRPDSAGMNQTSAADGLDREQDLRSLLRKKVAVSGSGAGASGDEMEEGEIATPPPAPLVLPASVISSALHHPLPVRPAFGYLGQPQALQYPAPAFTPLPSSDGSHGQGKSKKTRRGQKKRAKTEAEASAAEPLPTVSAADRKSQELQQLKARAEAAKAAIAKAQERAKERQQLAETTLNDSSAPDTRPGSAVPMITFDDAKRHDRPVAADDDFDSKELANSFRAAEEAIAKGTSVQDAITDGLPSAVAEDFLSSLEFGSGPPAGLDVSVAGDEYEPQEPDISLQGDEYEPHYQRSDLAEDDAVPVPELDPALRVIAEASAQEEVDALVDGTETTSDQAEGLASRSASPESDTSSIEFVLDEDGTQQADVPFLDESQLCKVRLFCNPYGIGRRTVSRLGHSAIRRLVHLRIPRLSRP